MSVCLSVFLMKTTVISADDNSIRFVIHARNNHENFRYLSRCCYLTVSLTANKID